MGSNILIFSLLLGLFFLLIVLRFIKKSNLRPSSILLWLGVSIFFISIPVFENFYIFISHDILGFENTANIIYIGIIGFILIYVLYLTLQINRLSDQVHILISHISILEQEIKNRNNNNTIPKIKK